MKKARTIDAAVVFIAAVTFFALRVNDQSTLTDETPVERAHRLCRLCGLDEAEIDRLIDETAHSRLDRKGLIELWEQTYDDPDKLAEAREPCMPCVEAVMEAAGPTQKSE